MIGWLVRILLVFAGAIASWFVARDALNFGVVQMVVAICIFILFIVVAAFYPVLKTWVANIRKKNKKF